MVAQKTGIRDSWVPLTIISLHLRKTIKTYKYTILYKIAHTSTFIMVETQSFKSLVLLASC